MKAASQNAFVLQHQTEEVEDAGGFPGSQSKASQRDRPGALQCLKDSEHEEGPSVRALRVEEKRTRGENNKQRRKRKEDRSRN